MDKINSTNSSKNLINLANNFSLNEDQDLYKSKAIRAISQVFKAKGIKHIDYQKFKTDDNESFKNFLDKNSIVYRSVDLGNYDYTSTIPSTIACFQDDFVCIYPVNEEIKFYSAANNSHLSRDDVKKLGLSDAFEIYAGLHDESVNFFDIFSFTFNGQCRSFLLLLTAALFTTILYLLLPLFTDILTSVIVPYSDFNLLINCSIGFVLILGVSSFSIFIQNILLIRLETITDLRLQVALWDRLVKLPLSLVGIFNTGDLNSRVDAITRIRDILTSAVLQSLLGSLFTILYLIIMLIYAPIATLIILPIIAALLLILAFIIYQKFKLQVRVFQTEADTLNFSLQAILNVVPFKSAGAEGNILTKWLKEINKLAVINLKTQSYEDAANYIVSFARTISLSVIFFYIYVRLNLYPSQVLSQKLSEITGSYVTFLVAFQAFLTGVSELTLLVGSSLSEVYVQWHRARPIFSSPVDEGYSQLSAVHRVNNEITFNNISYKYPDGFTRIFHELSMSFKIGKYTAIKGHSGCGKSTLIKLLLGLEEPTSGTIQIDHLDIKKINIRSYRREIGVVMQDLSLFPASIFKNMCGGLDYSEDEVWHALERAKIADEVHAMPMQLNTLLTNGGLSLSGGQQQRLCIARALMGTPRILLLDEATSALDPRQQEELLADLISQNVTLISIAHRLSTIKSADIIYTINNGKAEAND